MISLFSTFIETSLDLPFLIPGAARLGLLLLCAVAVSVAASSLSASLSAYRTGKLDTALVLRGENG